MKKHRNLYKILCIGLAVFLWFYVFIEVNPTTTHKFDGLNIRLENQKSLDNKGMAIKSVTPSSIEVKLEGKRGQFYYLRPNIELLAMVDGSKLNIGNNTVSVKTIVPDGYKVIEKYPGHVKIKVEKKITTWKDIVIKRQGKLPENKEIGNIKVPVQKLRVSSPASVIDDVHAVALKLNADKIVSSGEKTVRITPIAIDKFGKKIKNAEVISGDVRVSAEICSIKKVPLRVNVVVNSNSDKQVSEIDTPKYIYIKGDDKVLENIKEIETHDIVISSIASEGKVLAKPMLPSGVELSDKNLKIVVSYKIK